MSEPGWKSMLFAGSRARRTLRAALLTSYDRPDERMLVENVLPDLLQLERSPGGDELEQRAFVGELARQLECLPSRIVVVCSMPQTDTPAARPYPWLVNYLHLLQVGRKASAVQHAKLWLLHWDRHDEEPEQLELIASSANLTAGALRNQLQAAWRVTLPLQERGSEERLRGWGPLPAFLERLGEASGGEEALAGFRELLRRAECPEGVRFLASVPGAHTRASLRQQPWGSAGLEQVLTGPGRSTIRVTVPYVGMWDQRDLAHWCQSAGAEPKLLTLLWLDKHHPWARQGEQATWRLPAPTLSTFLESRVGLLRMEPQTSFHKEHRAPQDTRWSHAKLYHFKRGRAERLLLTSANFSRAAWGAPTADGGLRIENFELGVCLEKVAWPVDETLPFEKPSDVFTTNAETSEATRRIGWADAAWDGREVTLRCRVNGAGSPSVSVSSANQELVAASTTWEPDEPPTQICRLPWHEVGAPPTLARFTLEDEHCEVGVRDLRPVAELRLSPLPDMSESESEELRDRLLLEEYGHYFSEGDDDTSAEAALSVDDSIPPPESAALPAANYAVAVFEMARARFQIVDQWTQLAEASLQRRDSQYLRDRRRDDGERLVRRLERAAEQAATATLALPNRLAAEELAWRLVDLRVRLEDNDE